MVLGSPGVGKGTYTSDLVKKLKLIHISSGDIFRDNIKRETKLGKEVEEFIAEGKLVPDKITIPLMEKRLTEKDCQKGFVLDGFPRNVSQAEAMEKLDPLDLVLNFKANHEVIMGRLGGRIICRQCSHIFHLINLPPKKKGVCDACGGELYQRDDDKPEAIEKRLKLYEDQTLPLIKFYSEKGLLKEVLVNEDYSTHKKVIQAKIMKAIKG